MRKFCRVNQSPTLFLYVAERAAKIVEHQERERSTQKQVSPRAGTPVGALMGVVPSPSTMGMINQSMTPVSGNPSQRQHECLTHCSRKLRLDCSVIPKFLTSEPLKIHSNGNILSLFLLFCFLCLHLSLLVSYLIA